MLRAYRTADGFCGAVGNTPLIRLRTVSEETGCEILAKAEWMNPGGSVKDRAAWGIIKAAEEAGLIKPGGTIVEGTAGNTGIGMAHVCKARGYNCVIYMPNNQSPDKMTTLRALGATVHPVPAVPLSDPQNYNHQAKRHAESLENAFWGHQFDNTANKQIHIETTGPEIWAQTEGKVDAFTCATGTGGTFAGVTAFLKSKSAEREVKCYVADPPGSVLFNFYNKGELVREGTGSVTEGIGQGRVTENMKGTVPDGALHIPDSKSIAMLFHLLHKEGIFVGVSSALNVVAATEVAKILGPGHTIVTVLCDSGHIYRQRILSKAWLQSKGLFEFVAEEYHSFLTD